MPWAAGVYTRGYPSWSNDAASNLPISATKFDTEDNDFAAGLNNCLTKDSLNVPSGAISWGLASAQILALTRGNDGTVFSLARTGGTNNPALSFAEADATGYTITNSFGTLALTSPTLTETASTGPLTMTATAGAVQITAGSGTLTLGVSNSASQLQMLGAGNLTLLAPSSGTALTATGFSASPVANFISGTGGSVTGIDLQVSRAGSNATPTLQQGPNITINDTSAGRTATWQINGTNMSIWSGAVRVFSMDITGSLTSILGHGPQANTLIDMSPDTGSFTGTLTGCTTSPTVTVNYSRQGNQVTLNIPALTATSNTTACTLNGIPSVIQPVRTHTCSYLVVDNGVAAYGSLRLDSLASTLTLQKVSGAGYSATMTGSGTKGVGGGEITYFLN